MSYTTTVAGNIRANMARTNHRISDLAEKLGKTPNTAGNKYNGTAPITVEEIGTISEWLNVPIAEFFRK